MNSNESRCVFFLLVVAHRGLFDQPKYLEQYFDRELDLPLRYRRSQQGTCGPSGSTEWVSCGVENIRIAVARSGDEEVRVIYDVEHLHPELHVEILGNAFNGIVLENREIQARDSRAN